jgi:hypothetical protein
MNKETELRPEKTAAGGLLFGWTPRRVIAALLLLFFSAAVVLFALENVGVVLRSTAVASRMLLLTGVGVTAGTVGARHRKAGNWGLALVAYRVAVWCLFLAVMQVPNYVRFTQLEEFQERWQEDRERTNRPEKEQQLRNGSAEP